MSLLKLKSEWGLSAGGGVFVGLQANFYGFAHGWMASQGTQFG